MAQVPRNEGFSVAPNERAAYQGTQYIDPGIKFETPDFSKAAERMDKFQMQLDETRADAQIMELQKRRLEFENGANGFKKLLGEDAQTADADGRGLVQRYDEDLRKVGDGLMSGLTANQQRVFRQKAESVYQAQYGTAMQHVLEQTNKWQNDTYVAKTQLSVESAHGYFNKPEELARLGKDIDASARKLQDLHGWSSAQTNLYIKKNTSAMYKTAVAAALEGVDQDPRKAVEALAILDANSKNMLGADVLELRKIINGYTDVISVDNTSSLAMQGSHADMESPITVTQALAEGKFATPEKARAAFTSTIVDIVGGSQLGADGKVAHNKEQLEQGVGADKLTYGASQLSIPKARKAIESTGGVFDEKRFLNDKGYNVAAGAAYYEYLATKYCGDVDTMMAAWYTSEEQVDDAKAAAERAGDPANWMADFMPAGTLEKVSNFKKSLEKAQRVEAKDDQGEAVNALTPDYSKFKGGRLWATKEELYKRAEENDPRMKYDPTYRKKVEADIDRKLGIEQTSYAQQQANAVVQAQDAIIQHNGDFSKVPQHLLASLDIAQREALMKYAKKVADRDESTNDKLYYRLMSNDSLLASLTEEQFKSYRCEIAGAKWENLKKQYYTLKETASQNAESLAKQQSMARQGQYTGNWAKVTASETKNALKEIVPTDQWEKLEKNPEMMQIVIGNAIEWAAGRGQEANIEVHGKERNMVAVLQPFVANQLNVPTWYGGSTKKMFAAMRAGELPDSGPGDAESVVKMLARGLLEDRLGPGNVNREPNEREMDEALGILFFRKELTFSIPPNYKNMLDQSLVDEIVRANNGIEPPANELLRQYIRARVDGVQLESQKASGLDLVEGDISDNYYSFEFQ